MRKKTITTVFLIIAAIAFAIAGVYYVINRKSKEEAKEQAEGAKELPQKSNVSIDMGDVGKGTENALKNMPATNPLENVANPFRDAYKNPFE